MSSGFDISMFLRNRILKFKPILLTVLKLLTSAWSESGRVEERKITSGKPRKTDMQYRKKIGMKKMFCFSVYFQGEKKNLRKGSES